MFPSDPAPHRPPQHLEQEALREGARGAHRRRRLGRLAISASMLGVAGIALLALVVAASAAPFFVGDKRCGTIKKRPTQGWIIENCDPLQYVADLPSGCACATYGRNASGAIECLCAPCPCNVFGWDTAGNVECLCSSAPSPGPSAECPQGELPPINRPGFDGWVGRDNVRIATGATHRYCVTLDHDTSRLEMSVGDRTATAQCAWLRTTYRPPAGSNWVRPPGPQTGRNSAWTFLSTAGPLPHGVWTIEIENRSAPECFTKYQVVAHE